MRITQSKDGVPRFNLKLDTRISLQDMAIYLLCAWRFESGLQTHYGDDETTESRDARIENALKALMSGHTTKELMARIRETILIDGTETPHYTVGDSDLGEFQDFLTGLISRRFTRFQTEVPK